MDNEYNNIDEQLLKEDDRIANYLKGRMTADEVQVFMQELKSNPELKAKAIAIARLAKGLKEVGAMQDQETMNEMLCVDESDIKEVAQNAINPIDQDELMCADEDWPRQTAAAWRERPAAPERGESPAASMAPKSPMLSMVKWLSMAASILLIVWAGFGYNDYRKTTSLGNQYGGVFESSQLTRGAAKGAETSEAEAKLTKLFDNIKEKNDLNNTIHELTLCWELAKQETYNDYTDYAPEIGWNLAIGYLKDNDKKNAKAVLEQLTDIVPAGTSIGDKARELLNRVANL